MPGPVVPAESPRVLVVGLGGTIAMTHSGSGGVTPNLSARDLVDAVPGLADVGVDIDVNTFRSRPGASLTAHDPTELTQSLTARFAEGVRGAVITQGTDTIEETAYLLDLLHDTDHPIVVTGAMRNPTLAGADGPANLLAAITVAASSQAAGLGCLVVSPTRSTLPLASARATAPVSRPSFRRTADHWDMWSRAGYTS